MPTLAVGMSCFSDGCHWLLVSQCFSRHSAVDRHWLTSSQWHPARRPPGKAGGYVWATYLGQLATICSTAAEMSVCSTLITRSYR
jgi:hypothetical protein